MRSELVSACWVTEWVCPVPLETINVGLPMEFKFIVGVIPRPGINQELENASFVVNVDLQ